MGQTLEPDDLKSLVKKVTKKKEDEAKKKEGEEEGAEPAEEPAEEAEEKPLGPVSWVTFLLCLGRLLTGKIDAMDMFTEEECIHAFSKFDRSSSGVISPAELMRTGGKFYTGGHMTIEDAKEMVRSADVDKDGQINFDDFVIMMMMEPVDVFMCRTRGVLTAA